MFMKTRPRYSRLERLEQSKEKWGNQRVIYTDDNCTSNEGQTDR